MSGESGFCSLGGLRVANTSAVGWSIQTGTEPYIGVFEVHESIWGEMEAIRGKEVDLIIQTANGRVRIQKLTPIHEVPASTPFHRGIAVADRRWRWSYGIVVRDYNITRKTGDTTYLNGAQPVELGVGIDGFHYLEASLDGEDKPWTAERMMMDVLDAVDPGKWTIENFPLKEDGTAGSLTVQNVELRHGGNKAVRAALDHIPGADLYVNEEGRIIVIDALDYLLANQTTRAMDDPTTAGGVARRIDMNYVRPREVKVYFVREVELRFDYEEVRAGGTVARDPDGLYLNNVIPLPDPETTIDGKKRGQGTWVPIHKALTEWDKDKPTASQPWTTETIQRHWMVNLEAALGLTSEVLQGGAGADKIAAWAARGAMIRQHYRQTFQINEKWRDRLRGIKAVRVGSLDPLTGTRPPALSWSQYCVHASFKGIMVSRDNPGKNVVYQNVDGALDPSDEIFAKPVTQGRVALVDAELGIISLVYTPGVYGLQQAFYPSLMWNPDKDKAEVPHRNLSYQGSVPVAVGSRIDGAGSLVLAPEFKCSILVSGTPAAPNSKAQCHHELVTVADLDPYIENNYGLAEGEGPTLEIFVPPQEVTSRWEWQVNAQARETAKQLVGLGGAASTAGLRDDPSTEGNESLDLVGYNHVNHTTEVRSNALSAAAVGIAQYADAVEGSQAANLRPGIPFKGNVTRIEHSIGTDGAGASRVTFNSVRPVLDRFALLDSSARTHTLSIIPAGPA